MKPIVSVVLDDGQELHLLMSQNARVLMEEAAGKELWEIDKLKTLTRIRLLLYAQLEAARQRMRHGSQDVRPTAYTLEEAGDLIDTIGVTPCVRMTTAATQAATPSKFLLAELKAKNEEPSPPNKEETATGESTGTSDSLKPPGSE